MGVMATPTPILAGGRATRAGRAAKQSERTLASGVVQAPWRRKGHASTHQLGHHGRMSDANTRAVVVWLVEPLWGVDPDTGEAFKSTRHVAYADRVVQDAGTTVLVDDDGEVVGEWATKDVVRIDWHRSVERARVAAVISDEDRPARPSVGSIEWRARVAELHPRAYHRWTEEEDDELRTELESGDDVKTIARSHQRQPSGIRSRIAKLGLGDDATARQAPSAPKPHQEDGERCRHDMLPGTCQLCQSPPAGMHTMVFITQGGRHFHNDEACPALRAGWAEAEQRQQQTHPVRQVSWTEVVGKRERCRTCVPAAG